MEVKLLIPHSLSEKSIERLNKGEKILFEYKKNKLEMLIFL